METVVRFFVSRETVQDHAEKTGWIKLMICLVVVLNDEGVPKSNTGLTQVYVVVTLKELNFAVIL